MKKTYLLFLLIFTISLLFAQHRDHKRDYQWIFGYNYAAKGVIFDFNSKPVKQLVFKEALKPDLSQDLAEICDTAGQFIAVANGCQIYNKQFLVMKNGKKLNPGYYTSQLFCTSTGSQYFQSSIMLPKPQNDSLIYLFHKIADKRNGVWFTDTLRLSIINAKKDNGNGEAILKNFPIYNDTMTSESMTAVRHANGIDWWLINPSHQADGNDNRIILHLVTKDSIKGPFIQAIGNKDIQDYKDYPQAGFSPDGTKFFRYFNHKGLYYYKFDREKGMFSDFKFFKMSYPTAELGGATFSANSRYLYMSGIKQIYQLDTEAQNWSEAIDTVADWDNFVHKGFPSQFSYMLLAPDCKIYVMPYGSIPYINVINYPNRKGKACKVEQQVKLITHTDNAPPNYPNFRLGKLGESFSPCDSTINPYITGIGDASEKPIIANIYPNPASYDLNLDLFGYVNNYQKGKYVLSDLQGHPIATYPLLPNHDEYRFDISQLQNGIYLWQLVLDDKVRQSGKMVVLKE